MPKDINSMKDILIIGNGGHAKEVAFLIEEINRAEENWNILGFISKGSEEVGATNGKYRAYCSDEDIVKTDVESALVFGIGDPVIVGKLQAKFSINSNLIFPNLIHPKTSGDFEYINMGKGNVIFAGTVLTTNINIGSYNVFNLNCTVSHDSGIGNCNIISPSVNISGEARIGNNVFLGTGVQLLQRVSICDDAIVGAGAVVAEDIEEPGTYVGIPARKLNK